MKLIIYTSACIGLFALAYSCKKENPTPISQNNSTSQEEDDTTTIVYPPQDTAVNAALSIHCMGYDKALYSASIWATNDYEILEKGICYSTSPLPTISANDTLQKVGSYLYLNNLSPSTVYYIRSYGMNQFGTFYSEQDTITTIDSPPPLSIGDYYQGGYIFSINCTGTHGSIVYPENFQQTFTHFQSRSVCENLEYEGYDDWYMPHYSQLLKIYNNLYQTGILTNFEQGTQVYDGYWSKSPGGSQYYDTLFYYQRFSDGYSEAVSKFNNLNIRPVRSF